MFYLFCLSCLVAVCLIYYLLSSQSTIPIAECQVVKFNLRLNFAEFSSSWEAACVASKALVVYF